MHALLVFPLYDRPVQLFHFDTVTVFMAVRWHRGHHHSAYTVVLQRPLIMNCADFMISSVLTFQGKVLKSRNLMWIILQSTNLQATLAKFHERFWKSRGAKSLFWFPGYLGQPQSRTYANPSAAVPRSRCLWLRTEPKQICSDLQTRMAYGEPEPGLLTQVQPAVAVLAVHAGVYIRLWASFTSHSRS